MPPRPDGRRCGPLSLRLRPRKTKRPGAEAAEAQAKGEGRRSTRVRGLPGGWLHLTPSPPRWSSVVQPAPSPPARPTLPALCGVLAALRSWQGLRFPAAGGRAHFALGVRFAGRKCSGRPAAGRLKLFIKWDPWAGGSDSEDPSAAPSSVETCLGQALLGPPKQRAGLTAEGSGKIGGVTGEREAGCEETRRPWDRRRRVGGADWMTAVTGRGAEGVQEKGAGALSPARVSERLAWQLPRSAGPRTRVEDAGTPAFGVGQEFGVTWRGRLLQVRLRALSPLPSSRGKPSGKSSLALIYASLAPKSQPMAPISARPAPALPPSARPSRQARLFRVPTCPVTVGTRFAQPVSPRLARAKLR